MKYSLTISDLTADEARKFIALGDGMPAAQVTQQPAAQTTTAMPGAGTTMPGGGMPGAQANGAAAAATGGALVDAPTKARLNELMTTFISPPRSAADAVAVLAAHGLKRVSDCPAAKAVELAAAFGGGL